MTETDAQSKPNKNYVRLPMICVCRESPGVQAAADNLAWAQERFTNGTPNFTGWKGDWDTQWFSWVLHSLNADFNAHIDGIATDMWHGVSVSVYGDDKPNLYIPCDDARDGLLAIMRWLYDNGYEETL